MPVERENFRNKIQFLCAQRLELICYKLIYTIFIRYVSWSSIKSCEQLIMKDQNMCSKLSLMCSKICGGAGDAAEASVARVKEDGVAVSSVPSVKHTL